MTFRERIADWISGGSVKAARSNADFWRAIVDEEYGPMVDRKNREIIDAKASLRRIASCETPKASHTVRKMAAIAREGLK